MCAILLLTVVLITTSSVVGDFKLLILHNNDMHSHFEETSATSGACQLPGSCYGGFARIKRTVDDIREQQKDKRNVLFLNAGDTFQGTPYYSVFKWKVVADFIDHLGIDVMSLGNHEFDDGPKGLAPYLNDIKTVSVTANIDITEEPTLDSPQLKPYEILNVNGTKIAVIGYLTPNTTYLSETGKVKFLDEVEAINKQIEELKKQNISIFIGLGHSGYNIDLEIARRVPEIDLVVGGHTNTFLYNGNPPDLEKPIDTYPKIVTQESNRKVPVVQAYAYTKYLGYLEIDFDDKGEVVHYSGNPILLNNNYPQDDGILNLLKPWQDKLGHITHEVIGKTKVFLDAHNRVCKLNECNIGNLIVDAMIEANSNTYKGPGWSDAPIALIQAGAIRSSIDASNTDGNVTYGDVVTALPNEDELFKGTIKGVHLRETLEFSVHRYSNTILEQVGEFLQLAGIRVTYNMSAEPGKRVLSARIRCGRCNVPTYSELKDDEEYTLILTSFLKKGGDNYVSLRDNIYNVTSLNTTDTDAVVSYIRKRSPVYPLITNRIKIVGVPPEPPPTTESPISSSTSTLPFTTEGSSIVTITTISERSTAESTGSTTEISISSSTDSTIQSSTGSSTTLLPVSINTTTGSTPITPETPGSTEPSTGSPTPTQDSGAITLEYLTSLLIFAFIYTIKIFQLTEI